MRTYPKKCCLIRALESMQIPAGRRFVKRPTPTILVPATIRRTTRLGTTFGNPSFPEFIQFLTGLFIGRLRFFHFCILFRQKLKTIISVFRHIFSILTDFLPERILCRHPASLNQLKSNVKIFPISKFLHINRISLPDILCIFRNGTIRRKISNTGHVRYRLDIPADNLPIQGIHLFLRSDITLVVR